MDGFAIHHCSGVGWRREAAEDKYFSRVAEGLGNGRVPAIAGAKPPSRIGDMAHWDHWAAIAAALSSAASENHGGEFGVHGDIDFMSRKIF